MKKFFFISVSFISQAIYAQINCNNWLQTPARFTYVDIGKLNVTGNQITVEAEINRTQSYVSGGGDGSEGDIVSKHDNPNDINYLLRPNHAFITTTNGFFTTPDIANVELRKTYHVAMVYDGKLLKFYRDGCLMSQIAASGNLFQNSWNARIGYFQNQIWNTNFIGYINEVRIWNVARTQTEIQAYMNTSLPNPAAQPGLMAYYTFDNLLNKQGNSAYNGTLGGSASINQTNPECKAIVNTCLPPVSVSNIINEYTEVLNFDVCKNELIVADASKYNIGDTVLIIQMKGAVIDSSNTSTFGTITNYKNAGNYEFNIIKEKNGNRLSLLNVLERKYDIPKWKVQLVRVPIIKVSAYLQHLTCLPWDGSKGGVLSFNVEGNVNMLADIDVSGKGFRQGLPMNSTLVTMNEQSYYYDPSTNKGAQKGEGIYSISTNKNYGRGASSNGGGGGNGHNTGGGGGANGGNGGDGGDQWETGKTISENVGGKGGIALANSSLLKKLFLGGSGGMGQANDRAEYPSGNGGGIIIFSAGSINSNANKIKSNGANATEAPNSAECKDGMSGGGAGGSILLDITTINGTVAVEAKGGKGADHIAKNVMHGPGGGGGGGVIAVRQLSTPPQYSFNLSPGINGVNTNHGNNPYGATPGKAGISINNVAPFIDQVIFKPNIDSVRIKESNYDCKSFDFKGLAFIQSFPVNNWNWDFGDGNTSNVQNTTYTYATKGSYNVKLIITDFNGCKDSILKTVITSNIDVAKSADTSLCGSSPVKLFATGGSIYSWFPVTGLDNATVSNPVATPLVSTKYYVTVTNADGCAKLDSIDIRVNSLPVIVKSNDTTVCKDSPVPLSVGGGLSYIWAPASTLR